MNTSWTEKETPPSYPPLRRDAHADVVIIGAGMAGILSAYFLAQAGKKVIVLERGVLGGGATMMTTAFITQAIDTTLADLVSLFGADTARAVWQSGAQALRAIEDIVAREHIACDFMRVPAYLYANTDRQRTRLDREEKVAHELGFSVIRGRREDLPFNNVGYLKIPDQAKFHPLTFLHAVARAAQRSGAIIAEHTEVVQASGAGPVRVVTANGVVVTADDLVVTTYAPFNKPQANRFRKAVYRSYVLEAHIPSTELEEAIYWDQSNPYYYFRVDRQTDGSRVIFGGADHRADIPLSREKSFQVLERALVKMLGDTPITITKKWSGPILESIDGLPFIGTYAPHRHMATAFSGNGMTYSVIAGMIFRDAILGTPNPWTSVYDPRRTVTIYRLVKKGSDYIGRLLGAVKKILGR